MSPKNEVVEFPSTKPPYPMEERHLSRILPLYGELLNYCMNQAVQSAEIGSLAYNWESDEITYHYKLTPLDRDLFTIAHAVDEIWIVQKGSSNGS